MTARLPGSHCPDCGAFCDAATDTGEGGAVPGEGDITVCLCGSLLQFGAGMVLEPLDWSRVAPGAETAHLLRVQNAVLDMRGRRSG